MDKGAHDGAVALARGSTPLQHDDGLNPRIRGRRRRRWMRWRGIEPRWRVRLGRWRQWHRGCHRVFLGCMIMGEME